MKDKYILCDHISIQKNGRELLQNFAMSLRQGTSVCILGESGSGKSFLLHYIRDLKPGVSLMGSMDSYFLEQHNAKDWKQDLHFKEQDSYVQDFLTQFFKNKTSVSYKIMLLKKVFNRPDFLLLEDLTFILNPLEKELFIRFLKRLSITVLYVTRCIEDVLFFPYLIVLKNRKIAIEGKTSLVVLEEKIMKLLGFSIPFYVNMSLQLKLYGLINQVGYNKRQLEELLWP